MRDLAAERIEVDSKGQWLEYDPQGEQCSFTLLSATGELAILHYDGAPVIDGDWRRLGSHVNLGPRARHIDMQPDHGRWSFSVQDLGSQITLATLTSATEALLHTAPELDPTTKGVEILDSDVRFHPNQAALLAAFDEHLLYEDNDTLALNKPSQVSTHWDRSHHIGAAEIAQKWRGADISPVHRLDRSASGVLLFGKSRDVRGILGERFKAEAENGHQKIYIAIVEGEFGESRYIECFIERKGRDNAVTTNDHGRSGKLAKTIVKKIAGTRTDEGEGMSVLAVRTLTGRQHQIRATLAHIGYPIIDDSLYNDRRPQGQLRLHAAHLKINHPRTGRPLKISAPLPPDFFKGMAKPARV